MGIESYLLEEMLISGIVREGKKIEGRLAKWYREIQELRRQSDADASGLIRAVITSEERDRIYSDNDASPRDTSNTPRRGIRQLVSWLNSRVNDICKDWDYLIRAEKPQFVRVYVRHLEGNKHKVEAHFVNDAFVEKKVSYEVGPISAKLLDDALYAAMKYLMINQKYAIGVV